MHVATRMHSSDKERCPVDFMARSPGISLAMAPRMVALRLSDSTVDNQEVPQAFSKVYMFFFLNLIPRIYVLQFLGGTAKDLPSCLRSQVVLRVSLDAPGCCHCCFSVDSTLQLLLGEVVAHRS